MFLLICLILITEYNLTSSQNDTSVEVQKCTQYKRDMFEEVITFGAFSYDAPEMQHRVDKCKAYAPFIVGGNPANPKEFPHMARLGNANSKPNSTVKWFCGGTLISEKYVMTAAHCFYSNFGEVNIVRLGELDFSTDKDDAQPEDFNVRRCMEHPDYVHTSVYNDIGVIELDRLVIFNAYIHPACLPTSNSDSINQFLAVGWGSTSFGDKDASHLLKVGLERIDNQRCRLLADDAESDQLQNGINVNTQFCAGSNDTRDTCSGDSGGPLLAYHMEYPCMYYVIGITSSAFGGCAVPNVPGLYTRVYHFINWLRQVWQ